MLRFTRGYFFGYPFEVLDDDMPDLDETRSEDGVLLSPAAIRERRRLLLAAGRIAHATLAERPAAERDAPLAFASQATSASAFRAALSADVRFEILLAAFTPTVFLHPESGPPGETSVEWWHDDVPPHGLGKGVLDVGSSGQRTRIRGEACFLPPALRGEGRRRSEWIRAADVDPPRMRDEAGPFWSLGETDLWRLEFLGWHEQLVLAAAVGTRLPVTAVVCEPGLFPRIGWVVETARERGRTLVHVPLDAVPAELRTALEASRELISEEGRGLVTVDAALDSDLRG